ncbi:hypothetical protein Tco_1188522 [Tanacetum coccineum]
MESKSPTKKWWPPYVDPSIKVLELAPAAADAALQTIARHCVSSELQNALLRLGCCGICQRRCLVRATYALSRISGMAAESPTPYNQDAADALKTLLTLKLASMLKDEQPKDLLIKLNSNLELLEII